MIVIFVQLSVCVSMCRQVYVYEYDCFMYVNIYDYVQRCEDAVYLECRIVLFLVPEQNGVSQSMIYSRDIPFWSETLANRYYYIIINKRQTPRYHKLSKIDIIIILLIKDKHRGIINLAK